jgi:Zn-dependent peptidase ImmA (M78 family)
MIEKQLLEKYGEYLNQLDIRETNTSIKLSMIEIKPEYRYDVSKGGENLDNIKDVSVNTLIQFYKKFGFKMNTKYGDFTDYSDTMVRDYKKKGMKENIKPMIKSLLREALDKKITCTKCGWHWKESESDKKDMYICHKCNHDNTPKKENLNERILTKKEKDVKIMADFVNFVKKNLDIEDDVKVSLAYERTPDITTTAYYNLDGFVKIYVKDRAIIDVMRSVGHELVHHKQNLEGRLNDSVKDGEDGSEIENEANAVAGKLIRIYGKLYPELYV